MKWLGMDGSSPVNDEPGALTLAQNTRMTVAGELRRRRGSARTSLAKASSAITAIADFSLSPSNPYALTFVGGTINGDQGISSLWGDAALSGLSGSTTPVAGPSFTVNITRGSCLYATSVLVYAKAGRYPSDQDMGVFVGEVAMLPWATTATTTWTAPDYGTWLFRVYPVRERRAGPGANLTPVDMGSFLVSDTLTFSVIQLFPAVSSTITVAGISASYITGDGTTSPVIALGQAIADAAVTLPLVMTMTPATSLSVFPPGILVQSARSWTSAAGFVTPSVSSGVVCAHVTASTGRNIAVVP